MAILAAYVVPHPPILLPEIGKGEERKLQLTTNAYERVMKEAASFAPQTVIISSPHAPMYADYFHISPGKKASGSFATFGAPEVEIQVEYDTEFTKALEKTARRGNLDAGFLGSTEGAALDHGTMIPLYFLQKYMESPFQVVRLGLSGLSPLDHYRLGTYIQETATELGRDAIYIASGDLSHKLRQDGPYGFAPEGSRFDKLTMALLEKGDFLKLLQMDAQLAHKAAECGLRSFWIMAGALNQRRLRCKRISYQGPFGVGYGVVAFKDMGEDPRRDFGSRYDVARRQSIDRAKSSEDTFAQLARQSIEHYILKGEFCALPKPLPEGMEVRKGVFVTIFKNWELRGCIGTFQPRQNNVAEEILYNAVSAALHDPRFSPVRADELADLNYHVDVLEEPSLVDKVDELDAKKFGIIVEARGRRGLLLPDLEGVDTVEAQLKIARQKGGISADEPVRIWKFTVERHQ